MNELVSSLLGRCILIGLRHYNVMNLADDEQALRCSVMFIKLEQLRQRRWWVNIADIAFLVSSTWYSLFYVFCQFQFCCHCHLCRHLASEEGIMSLGVRLSHCVCMYASAALVLVAKVICCIQCSLVFLPLQEFWSTLPSP